MSNRRRPRRTRRPAAATVTKVRSPADIVTVVPYLLGFDPAESIVVVAIEGARQRFGPCARLDLVEDEQDVAHQVDYVCGLIAQHGFDPVILVAYSSRVALAEAVVRGIIDELESDGVEVREAVRADAGRWWSYTCDDPVCCPEEGTPYDDRSSRVAAEAVVAGLARAPSRDALREQFEPHPGQQAAFEESLHALAAGPGVVRAVTEDAIRTFVREAVTSSDAVAVDELVRVVVAVQDVRLRDAAWRLMTRDNAPDHFGFWVRALRATPDDLAAPVGSLAAFAAWLSGRGVLASHAAERVLDTHPAYSMAKGVLKLCATSVDPAMWTFDEPTESSGQAS